MSFKEEKIRQFRDLPDRVDLEREGALLEEGKVKIELIKAKPEVHLHKWNSEINLGIYYDKIQKAGQKVGNRMEWKDQKEEIHAYPLEAQEGMENGGLELEVLLKEKPDTNKFIFQIDGAENLNFFYQPALTQEEIDEGDNRPENVIGSYAVYHKTKSNHRTGSTNYATGKAFHIYRPKAIDASGVEEWAELLYENGVLSVTVPQQLLDEAVYPVRVDPTFGYTSIGANSTTISNGIGGNVATLSENGDISSFSIYVKTWSAGVSVKGGLYDSSDLYTSNQTEIITSGSINQWTTFNFASPVSRSAADHGLIAMGSATSLLLATDSGQPANSHYFNSTDVWPTFPADISASQTSSTIKSIYATYTASGGNSIKTKKGLAIASVKTFKGLAIANVKTSKGLTNV